MISKRDSSEDRHIILTAILASSVRVMDESFIDKMDKEAAVLLGLEDK